MVTLVDRNAGLDVRLPALVSRSGGDERIAMWNRKEEAPRYQQPKNGWPDLFDSLYLGSARTHTQVAGHLKRLETEDGVELLQSKISKTPLGEAHAHRASTTNAWPPLPARGQKVGVCAKQTALQPASTCTFDKISDLKKTWKSWSLHMNHG
jgi:hypothetical protein